MYSLNVVYKQKTKKMTLPKNINQQDLLALISDSFRLKQKLIGLANAKGNLVNIQQLIKKNQQQTLYLITAQDLNGDNMSFASDGGENMRQNFFFEEGQLKQPEFIVNEAQQQVKIPQKAEGSYQGVIGDLQLFESLFLQEGKMTIVLCFIKEKPRSFMFPYYLYHTAKNSVMIYMGRQRICEFFVESMNEIPKQVTKFIRSSLGDREIGGNNKVEENQEKELKPFSKIKPSKPKALQQVNKKMLFNKKNVKKVQKKDAIIINNNNKRRQLQRDFFQQQQQQQLLHNNNKQEQQQFYDQDNIQAQQLLNQFGDQQPVQPQHDEQEQQQFYNNEQEEQQESQQQQELPIFQSQPIGREQQHKRINNNIIKKGNKKVIRDNNIVNGKIKDNQVIESQQLAQQQYPLEGGVEDQLTEVRASLLENLLKLKQDEDITQLEFYKMKSQLLENLSDFIRKYQMGTRKGFRKQHQREYHQNGNNDRSQHQQRRHQSGKKTTNNGKRSQNINKKQMKNKQQRPVSESSGESQLMVVAEQRPEEKLRQRPKQRENTGEKQQKQRQNQKQQRQLQKQQDKRQHKIQAQNKQASSKNQSNKQQSYQQVQTHSIAHHQYNRQSSPQLATTPFSNQRRRSKKYEIPIIVRKYNNVIEKISTSYPLNQEQQQAINLILQLQLKGLITEKESGVYKSSILQQDKDIFPLFMDYFDHLIDQLQLVSRLKSIKRINSQKKQRSQHNMRLLIKYAKQSSYQNLRNLLLQNNHLVLAALDKFRGDKDGEGLVRRLERIAQVYRQKTDLETEVYE